MDLVMNVERWDTCGLEGMQKLRWVMMHIARILLGKIGWSLYDISFLIDEPPFPIGFKWEQFGLHS